MNPDITNKNDIDSDQCENINSKWRVGQIKRLVLHNIGGHELVNINLSPGINLITGGNGSGKSSLVSAIALLCGWNGKKAGKDASIAKYIRTGFNKGVIRIHFSNHNGHKIGYFPDIFGDEIIVERCIYLRGTSSYTFRGSKTSSPIYKGYEARSHLSQFREFSNIIINNPVTYLTQMDAKYLIREQGSPKSLYDFFQRAHLFDSSWRSLAEERLHLEKAESISNDLRNELNIIKEQLSNFANLFNLFEEYEKLWYHKENLDNIHLKISIENLSFCINNFKTQENELEKERSEMNLKKLDSQVLQIEEETNNLRKKLIFLRKEYENRLEEYMTLKKKYDDTSSNITSYKNKKEQIMGEMNKIRELIVAKEVNIGDFNVKKNEIENEFKISKQKEEFCRGQINLIFHKKNKLSTDISIKKNEFLKLKEVVEDIKKECEDLVIEKNLNKEKMDNLIKEMENNKVLLNKILNRTNKFEDINLNENTENLKTFKESKCIIYVDDNTSLVDYYKSIYDYYSDEHFECIFGYSKEIHNKVVSEVKAKYRNIFIIGPILLHIFVDTNLSENQRLLYTLDEILGGRLELEESNNLGIRRNYKYWIVDGSQTRNILIGSFRENNVDFDPTLIYIRSSFGEERYNLSNIKCRYPKKGLAVIDLLQIKDNEVFNFLVDTLQIETTFIFSNDEEMELIYDYNYNIRRAHSLASNSFRYRRGGIVVAPEICNFNKNRSFEILLKCIKQELFYNKKNKTTNINFQHFSPNKEYQRDLDQIEFFENLIKTNNVLFETLSKKITDIDNTYNILKQKYVDSMQNLGILENEVSEIENELHKLEKEEHLIYMKVDELNLRIKKLSKNELQEKDVFSSELKNLSIQTKHWENKLKELESKILKEEQEQDLQKVKIDEINKILESEKDSLNKIEEQEKKLNIKRVSLLETIPELQKREREISDEIKKIKVIIENKEEELKLLKIEYFKILEPSSNAFNRKDEEDTLQNERLKLNHTLEYFNWSGNLNDNDKPLYPDVSLIHSWKNGLTKKMDDMHLDIIKQIKNVGYNISEDYKIDSNQNLKKEIYDKYIKRNDFFEKKREEFEQERNLFLTNKINLNKRIQQLQENHIRCGKNVNLNFKHYFSLFWSKSMKPHLKFDHNNSTIDICVIPDAANIKKNKTRENSDHSTKISETDKLNCKNYIIREIQSLSGGESSSIGISFLLALSQSNSSPFHLFDEPDVYMDDIRRMIMIQSLIEFQKLCSLDGLGNNRQILFVTPHNEIVPYITENYLETIHVIQLLRK